MADNDMLCWEFYVHVVTMQKGLRCYDTGPVVAKCTFRGGNGKHAITFQSCGLGSMLRKLLKDKHYRHTNTVRAPVFVRHQFFGTSEHYGKAH